jgi:hypothetical protein
MSNLPLNPWLIFPHGGVPEGINTTIYSALRDLVFVCLMRNLGLHVSLSSDPFGFVPQPNGAIRYTLTLVVSDLYNNTPGTGTFMINESTPVNFSLRVRLIIHGILHPHA